MRSHIRAGVALAALAALLLPSQVAAHSPINGNPSWQNASGGFKFTPPSEYATTGFVNVPLAKAGVIRAIEVGWADPDTNNSNSMRFTNNQQSTLATVMLTSGSVAACGGSAFQGCANIENASQGKWQIWIKAGQSFCEEAQVNNCRYAERMAIHEIGHIGGFNDDCDDGSADGMSDPPAPSCSQANSVMQTLSGAPPWHDNVNGHGLPEAGWDHFQLQKCDEAGMQIRYDLKFLSGPYADCFDHVLHHGTFGLKTSLTTASSSYAACSGQTLSVSGRLDVFDGNYGRQLSNGSYYLDGNGLLDRWVSIWREGSIYDFQETFSSSGNNWTVDFTETTSVTHTVHYTVQFDRNATSLNTAQLTSGLDSSPTVAFTITWFRPAEC